MDIIEQIENESLIYDLETPKGCFLASFLPIKDEQYTDFLINKYQNDLYKLITYLEANRERYFIGFNNVSFDNQILEFIMDNYEKWYDFTGVEIATIIGKFGSKVIEDSNYGLFLPYRENSFRFKAVDAPRILHWFNENKRVSLKQAEVELRAENVENFEISPDKIDFTPEEVQNLIFYCHNDVRYTREVFFHVIGKTIHPLYKGRNKIADRVNFMKEVPLKCLNYDDVKLGAEWNKYDFCAITKRDEKTLKPKRVNYYYGKKYKKFFPETVDFQTDRIKDFVYELGETTILAEKQEFEYDFNDKLKVVIARGGLHSREKPRILQPNEDEYFIQNDIGSQYPKAMIKFQAFPEHLGKSWIDMIVEKVTRRLGFKKKYKETKDPKYNSLQETGKYSLNGGAYGRLGTPGDWQEDPCAMLKVTLGCQLEILMIVEALIIKGFNITSCNTDGWDAIIPKDRLEEYFETVEYYEKKILADPGTVEYTVFKYMIQTSVNDYMAEKLGVFEKRKFIEDTIVTKESNYPNLKLKGDFTVDFELHKNSSFRIIPIGLVEYFDKKTNVEQLINNHQDIFDFCARSSSGQTYYHEAYGKVIKEGDVSEEEVKKKWVEEEDGWRMNIDDEPMSWQQVLKYERNRARVYETYKLPKIIRYYVAKDGMHIKKIVKPDVETNANDTNVQPKDYVKKVCNRLSKDSYEEHLDNINRQFYIDKVNETIFRIEKGRKPSTNKINPNQTSLF